MKQQPKNNAGDTKSIATASLPLRRRWPMALIAILIAVVALWIKDIISLENGPPSFFIVNFIAKTNTSNNTFNEQHFGRTINEQDDNKEDSTCSCENNDRPSSTASSLFGLEGTVSDCCCSFEDIEQTNYQIVHPLLQKIVSTPFFSHFKIDLCSSCELWHDTPLCMLRDCGVCECDEPPEWAEQVEWMPVRTNHDPSDDCHHIDDQVVIGVDSDIQSSWHEDASSELSFMNEGEEKSGGIVEDGAVVVDLKLNPERYTGYSGPSAEKVWSAIHSDNCFTIKDEAEGPYCSLTPEQRVYNRIISGLHSSISLHIAHSYCLEMDSNRIAECKTWGTNPTLAHDRVLSHQDRLENLYVVFAVLLRAVQKAGSAVTAAVPTSDTFYQDSLAEWTEVLLPQLKKLEETCPLTFDETKSLLLGTATKNSSIELERRFQHLLQIMSCVGCDRCKLWGTLQSLGIGTALKVLLLENDDGGDLQQQLTLSRQEAVALIHTLERFSSALVFAHDLANEIR